MGGGDTRTVKLRIGMLGLYGMPMSKLHFTGFETGFGEIAPRLAEMGRRARMHAERDFGLALFVSRTEAAYASVLSV